MHSLVLQRTKLNKSNGSELSNAAAMSPFRYITWTTSVSIRDKALKGGKIHRYNGIREIAKTLISPSSSFSSSSSSNGLAQNIYTYLP